MLLGQVHTYPRPDSPSPSLSASPRLALALPRPSPHLIAAWAVDASVASRSPSTTCRKNGAAACPHSSWQHPASHPRPASTPPPPFSAPPRSPSAQVLVTHPSPSLALTLSLSLTQVWALLLLHTFIDTDFLPSLEPADVR